MGLHLLAYGRPPSTSLR
uniref:Uncharacterized protein n=1 Tax=Arundo donax TaxID=35708 RepID=A0A0A9B996_ARUDO